MLKAAGRLPQTYWVKVKGRLGDAELKRVGQEVHGRIHPLRAPRSAGRQATNPWYEVTLAEARRDLLRRTLVFLGHPVEKLKRVKLANLDLGGLPEGRYRHLEPEEVAALERAVSRAGQTSREIRTAGNRRSFTGNGTRRAGSART